MPVTNERLGTTLRLSRVYRFFGRDRETVPEAYPGRRRRHRQPGPPGDRRHAVCRAAGPIPAIPQFPAERFAYLRPTGGRHKRFDEAVQSARRRKG